MSIPFFDEEFTLTQPDGSKLEVRGWGNHKNATFKTKDGVTVAKDPVTGYYRPVSEIENSGSSVTAGSSDKSAALVSVEASGSGNPQIMSSPLDQIKTRWQIRREATKTEQFVALSKVGNDPAEFMTAARPQRETVGDFMGLCLLIDFPDLPWEIPQDEVEAFCNQPGYNGYGNNGSVYDYFFDNSGGRMRYKNTVTAYYTAQHDKAYYTDPAVPYPERAQELLHEALEHLQAKGFDANDLSTDDSGFIRATNILYTGNNINDWCTGLWPHSSSLVREFVFAPGKAVGDYQITNMGEELTLGTFCHENGHMICDFPDLYDYGRDKIKSFGVGAFCLMCFGGKISPKNPTQINAYLKCCAGWADSLTTITPHMDSSIQAGVNEFFIHRENEVEYFILENREKRGRDGALPGSGMFIWHVDELGSNENQHMTPGSHYECTLVQADGKFDFEKGVERYGEANDLFFLGGNNKFDDTTSPNSRWWSGAQSGVRIFDIGNPGQRITFKAHIDEPQPE